MVGAQAAWSITVVVVSFVVSVIGHGTCLDVGLGFCVLELSSCPRYTIMHAALHHCKQDS